MEQYMKIRKLLLIIGLALFLSPCINAEVFEDSKTQEAESKKSVFIDNSTNLMWQDDIEARTVRKNWQGAIDYCSNLKLAGYDDWRLPDLDTLKALYPKKNNLKNIVSDVYWSSSPSVSDSSFAWYVFFSYGYDYGNYKSYSSYVRCVRDSKNIETSKFSSFSEKNQNNQKNTYKETLKLSGYEIVVDETLKFQQFLRDNSKEVVIDTKRKLMWQDNIDARSLKGSWEATINHCKNLNFAEFDDWRLPSRMELLSITDKTKANPAIQDGFQNVVSDSYWSSSPYVSGSSDAWGVFFSYGYDYYDGKSTSNYVRCVRDSK